MSDPLVKLVEEALAGDTAAIRRVLDTITPAIQKSVAGTLRRHLNRTTRPDLREEVLDLTQDVLWALFANDGKRLRQWNPSRGLSLPRFAELISRHVVYSFLRTRSRLRSDEVPVEDAFFEQHDGGEESPESLSARRELAIAVLAAVEAELTSDAREVYEMLLEGLSVAEICEKTGLSANAVHIKRHRLLRAAERAAEQLLRGDFSNK